MTRYSVAYGQTKGALSSDAKKGSSIYNGILSKRTVCTDTRAHACLYADGCDSGHTCIKNTLGAGITAIGIEWGENVKFYSWILTLCVCVF